MWRMGLILTAQLSNARSYFWQATVTRKSETTASLDLYFVFIYVRAVNAVSHM